MLASQSITLLVIVKIRVLRLILAHLIPSHLNNLMIPLAMSRIADVILHRIPGRLDLHLQIIIMDHHLIPTRHNTL